MREHISSQAPSHSGNWVLFATERYAWPILKPLQRAIEARDERAYWWCVEGASKLDIADRWRIRDVRQARDLRPAAVFSAANWVPHFLEGPKVQVFHGFNVEKRSNERGHFRIRGLFDLYCTQGPATTQPFLKLARERGHFCVRETGWPKLDPLFSNVDCNRPAKARDRPIVLFGSTFTERLSAAPILLDTLRQLITRGDRYWLLTLHPKCPPKLFQAYQALACEHAEFIESEELIEAQAKADILLADTSSIVSEFIVQLKPVVTFRNRVPKPHMIDVQSIDEIDAALQWATFPDPALLNRIQRYAAEIHPYRDGCSSERVLAACDDWHAGKLCAERRKPLNWLRKLQVRKRLGYWGL